MSKVLVIRYHPRTDSLSYEAAERVIAGLQQAGNLVRVLDLAVDFEPTLNLEEWQNHVGGCAYPEEGDERGALDEHVAALRWATRLVLVYPTWFGGQPAVVKGWFDRVWVRGVAWDLPAGKNRIRGLLNNIHRIEIVTTHGSSRLVNAVQGNPGRLTVFRGLRAMCHPLCRTRWTSLYKLDRQSSEAISQWLDHLEERFNY